MIGKSSKIQSLKFKIRDSKIENHRPETNRASSDANRKARKQTGFTLLELMITMFILIILISVVMPTYQRSVQHARETVLQENLWQMRRSIDQYAADKGKLPQSINDLVQEKYLREIPVDPMTEKPEWKEIQGEDPNSPDAGQGLTDVKSSADGEDSEGKKFEDY